MIPVNLQPSFKEYIMNCLVLKRHNRSKKKRMKKGLK